MPVDILFPELGEGVHEGTVSRWLKKVGDPVKEDEPVVEIMTDKVNTELGAPAAGILSEILVPEGGTVEVFKSMGTIDDGSGASPSAKPSTPAAEPEKAPASASAAASTPAPAAEPEASGDKKWYTPVVRSMAKEHGLTDAVLAGIHGTGQGGRVTKKDVEGYLAGKPSVTPSQPSTAPKLEVPAAAPLVAGADTEVIQLVGMRKMIADAMMRSSQVPTVSTLTEVDVTNMVKFRERNKETFQEQFGVKLTYTPFFIKAITDSLLEFPLLNAALSSDNSIHMHKKVHMGIAVALGSKGDEGLIVPVIRDCQSKSLIDLAKDLEGIAAKARANQLSVSDVQGGTFTLTNPGSYGALSGTPMINAPQSGILGTYTIKQVPMIIDGMIAIRSVMNLVLTYDHRLVDGLLAGRFLQSIKRRLEQFEFFK